MLVEPGHTGMAYRPRDLVAETLGLTPGESQVAAWLAEGMSVDEMARATGRTRNADLLAPESDLPEKLYISRQADLVRLVLSVAELGITEA